jgi:hypothetical protein
MKANLMCLVGVSLAAIADSSVAQEYADPRGALGAYDGYYEYDAPVPHARCQITREVRLKP